MLLVVLVLLPVAVFHGVLFGVVGGLMGQNEADVDALAENIGLGVSIIVTWLYFAILESSGWQATYGKRALGIMVTDVAGRRIGFGRATARHFAKLLSGLFAGVGFLMIAWSSQRQGLHDGLAKTLVVRRDSPYRCPG
jgi:uncharacterized RDD family membrane protein YckC